MTALLQPLLITDFPIFWENVGWVKNSRLEMKTSPDIFLSFSLFSLTPFFNIVAQMTGIGARDSLEEHFVI